MGDRKATSATKKKPRTNPSKSDVMTDELTAPSTIFGDCPLCCEPFAEADLRYPMLCKTSTCSFDFCLSCLERFFLSSNEGYSEASDGSHQVKIHLTCPMCRAAYSTTAVEQKASEIVAAVIRLRVAAKLNSEEVKDSDRSASELARRNEFAQATSFVDLTDSAVLVQRYYDSVEKGPHVVTNKDVEAWKPYLQQERHAVNKTEPLLKRDQTLFYALEDFLTDDEQEFITALMTSGKQELLSQAAFLIYTVMSGTGRRLVTESNAAQIEHRLKVRKRFPLPKHMPRCVSLPMHNPLDRSAPFKFTISKDNSDVTLELSSVRGAAARVGLQQGDVVTEIQGEMVSTYGEMVVALQKLENLPSFLLTVNSTPQIATELRERASKMKDARVKFL
jgi:hypothetical protein